MPWYAAHLIMQTRFKDGIEDTFPLWELVVLIRAESTSEAFEKAKAQGKAREGDDDGTFVYNDRLATMVYTGVRKLIECDTEDSPGDGTEITYSRFETTRREEVLKLAKGSMVNIRYVE